MSGNDFKGVGFGFNPDESQHYFLVSISSSSAADIWISEHMSWSRDMWNRKIRAVTKETDGRLRVILSRDRWERIVPAVTAEFNARLKEQGGKRGRWRERGITPLSRLFGKELVLLAWAIEDADPGRVQTAVANWLGLKPEERWWLYTMTNAATGQALAGRNVGWRVAVRYALCENPIRGMSTETRVGLIAGLDEGGKGPVDKKQVTFADLARE